MDSLYCNIDFLAAMSSSRSDDVTQFVRPFIPFFYLDVFKSALECLKQARFKHASITLQARFKHASSTLQARFKHSSSKLQAHF